MSLTNIPCDIENEKCQRYQSIGSTLWVPLQNARDQVEAARVLMNSKGGWTFPQGQEIEHNTTAVGTLNNP